MGRDAGRPLVASRSSIYCRSGDCSARRAAALPPSFGAVLPRPNVRARIAAAGVILVALWGPPAALAGSPNVAALQVALRAEGVYVGSIDGVRGSATRAGVVEVQRRAGLPLTGIAGPRTRRALGRRGGPRLGSRTLSSGARGWDLAGLQFLLGRHGFPSGPVDGGFGGRTEAALIRFQRWAGLPVVGYAGPATRRALRRRVTRPRIHLHRPSDAPISSLFGPRGDAFHAGVDFSAPTGSPVRAAASGHVTSAAWLAGGYGYTVIVDHGGGAETMYPHLSRILVRNGQALGAGTVVGLAGSSGRSTGPHVHWELRIRGAARDPLRAR